MRSEYLAYILRSGLLSQAEKQLSDMHKEKAAWLKLQKTQQAQVTSLMTFQLIHASCKNWRLEKLHTGNIIIYILMLLIHSWWQT